MRDCYIASGRMVYHGMEFGCQADYVSDHTSLHLCFSICACYDELTHQ